MTDVEQQPQLTVESEKQLKDESQQAKPVVEKKVLRKLTKKI